MKYKKCQMSKIKKLCFTVGFKCQYIINARANVDIVTEFWSNQIITQRNISNAILNSFQNFTYN